MVRPRDLPKNYEARKRKTHAGLGGNAILKFTTGKLGLYHNFADRITPTGFAYVAFGSIRVSQVAGPRSSRPYHSDRITRV